MMVKQASTMQKDCTNYARFQQIRYNTKALNCHKINDNITPLSFQNGYAIHVTQNETSLLFVSCNDTLQIWNGTSFNSMR